MRLYSILFFTNDYTIYESFLANCKNALKTAYNRQTLIKILGSFNDTKKDKKHLELSHWGISQIVENEECGKQIHHVPIFNSSMDLKMYLEKYTENLSDLVVLVDCECDIISNEVAFARNFRSIMIEYPDVKFLFSSDPHWVLFDQEDILEDIWKEDVRLCEDCLRELSNCSEKGILKEDFLKKIYSKDEGHCDNLDETRKWNLLKKLCRTRNEKKQKDRIRDIKNHLSRKIALGYVNFDLLTFTLNNDFCLLDLVYKQDNLFDATNIRYAIKQWKYAELDVHSQNFYLTQKSRRNNLAVCIEEERAQNRFNSYCLYANGFRVLPVNTALALKDLNEHAELIKPAIIIRDYDLQFFDSTNINHNEGETSSSIKAIRGFRDNLDNTWETHIFDSPCWSSFFKSFHEGEKSSCYFSNLPDSAIVSASKHKDILCPIYYISKGNWNLSIMPPYSFIAKKSNMNNEDTWQISHYYTNKSASLALLDTEEGIKIGISSKNFYKHKENEDSSTDERDAGSPPKNKGAKNVVVLNLPGLMKPISGIYEPFRCIPEIRKRQEETETSPSDYLNTSREGHSHGTSLDIYSTVKSLIQRAEKYYNNGKYIHAAILSNDAIEYLNGFHEALLLKAYHILTISENAIAMDTIGGDEHALKQDTLFRITKIANEIDKILRRKKERNHGSEDRREFKYNVLNQIYSDCRKFCKDKEHFSAEDCFISAMAHVNEGFTLCDIGHEIKSIGKRVWNDWKAYKSEHSYENNK